MSLPAPRRLPMLAPALVLALAAAGCSSSDSTAGTAPVATTTEQSAGTSPPDFVRNPGETSPATGGDAPTTEPADPTTTLATVPDTGVPGIDSDDVFCRSWSEFAGSFRALGLVAALGAPDDAMRLEVLAAGAVVAAVDALGANLPPELEPERAALLDDFAGPFARRAARARSALADAGLDADALGAAWLEQLALSGIDDPELAVALPAAADPVAFADAVAAFTAALPPITQDPTLVTGADIPATEEYLEANCPDQGVLSGNDVISS